MVPKGFYYAAVKAKIKKWDKEDVGLIISHEPAAATAVFTTNRVKAAPVLLSQANLKNRAHRAIIVNSGNANAATGKTGTKNAAATVEAVARNLGIKTGEVLIASTGVIGLQLPMEKILGAAPQLAQSLGNDPAPFTRAIMTTDTRPKEASARMAIGGKTITVWGCAKGAGMIHPNMATMLAFTLTDAAIAKPVLQAALAEAAKHTFNRLTIDGDTSTNDTLILLANGAAGNKPVAKGSADYKKFVAALTDVCAKLSEMIVGDGEGVTRIAEIKVEKAKNENEALAVARAVAGSLLVKTALHGGDPNWGRIICAAGYSGVPVDPEKMELYFGKHAAYKNGLPAKTSEEILAAEMKKKKVLMRLVLNRGTASTSYIFCDLSREYVTINADYRT